MSSGPAVTLPSGAPLERSAPPGDLSLILVLGMLAAFGPLAIDMYLPAFPAIERSLHASPSAVGMTLAVYFAGLSLGQLVVGPLSDALGRTRPLRAGIALFVVGSVIAALAPSIELLIAGRAIQALGGSACAVVTRAVVRDVHRGVAAARMMSRLVLVMGVAPILAPLVGGAVLDLAGWRAIFGVLAVAGSAALVVVWIALPETAPPRSPERGGHLRALVRDRSFLRYAAAAALAQAGLFAYITGAPEVLIKLHGVPSSQFGWYFGGNAAGFIAASQVNARLVGRHGPARLFAASLAVAVVAAAILVAVAVTGDGGLPLTVAGMFLFLFSLGFVLPNAAALALEHQGARAGIASAWLGAVQFGVSATASSLVSALHDGTALPMAGVIAAFAVAAWLVAPSARAASEPPPVSAHQ